MDTLSLIIRQAQREDASIIAVAVAMAIGDEETLRNYCGDDYLKVLTEIASAEETQYSWQNTLIAEYDGKAAGAIVGYDGALLEKLRNGTFEILHKNGLPTPTIVNETEAGEFYLDSIAVMPEFRGHGIGGHLITAMRQKALAEGHERVGLIVDVDNPHAKKLYTTIGFKSVGSRLFFEHQMEHLQI